MKRKVLIADLLLLITAVIWGAAFVAQRVGMSHVGPFTFNGIRFLLGGLVLLPLALREKTQVEIRENASQVVPGPRLVPACFVAGILLFFGSTLQQVGIVYTTAGKAGFITGLYVLLVPLFGRLVGQKTDYGSWIGAILAAIGLYFLSVTEALTIAWGDLLVLIGAGFWAVHVLVVGYVAKTLRPTAFASGQFLTCAVLSLLVAILYEEIRWAGLLAAAAPIFYGSFISVGIGYTLQVVAQKDSPSAHAAILLSLEAVFSAIAGWILVNEVMAPRALFGCGLLLSGTVIAQVWPVFFPPKDAVGT